ncbi:uncharacterized protein CcaverHIS019_0201910 [Cutaneotrichosporon cavernicola]|uniref:Extradiol ring-cleavage dioxygenase class III enzyme subunit B domain-containing protein n=1 Tax=Cutaneotrichosporon cavernicola TaxID=279322 RepID=A0AA48I3B4_9TREE|nr:uncharacterized protein CcaverHIS019_0201910 [Cutaneotrichosporon cavernicola]BEI88829.1 hypothetical protein CcaverHIS019_0201910 [Cutaneotrichosporon cavernicola]BEI96604.1 hypothetical protein CcaverHIS631_0201930 [Cutaneotrichosporon cavernicola]BEJ04376.1 hypothetical protein CcaverHIS641_0201930 [Cutaneotrichosporon cavernicola]
MATAAAQSGKGQVYFLSHGGPPTMFETTSAPYKAWQKYGKMIEAEKPRGLVVVSAHWENPSHSDGVVVNTDSSNPLVYDFYGFPKNYYEQKFASRGDPQMLKDVTAALKSSGVEASTDKRGLDHGVWVPFLVAFAGKTAIPIVQVSLPGDSNPVSAAKLGKALSTLRDEGYSIMGSGQAVHNLRDYMMGGKGSYGDAFLHAIEGALHSDAPAEGAIGLFRHPAYRQAHPTPEHLLPLVVAAAAADPKTDALQDIFVQPNGPLGWGMWMWKPKAAL